MVPGRDGLGLGAGLGQIPARVRHHVGGHAVVLGDGPDAVGGGLTTFGVVFDPVQVG